MGITRRLAEFVLRTSFDDLPAEVVARSKDMMLNAAAVGLAGAAQPEGQIITSLAQEMRGNGRCTIFGMGLRTSPLYAALCNGVMVHLLDFDDEAMRRGSHPSSVIFPVVMSLGEMNGYSGKAVLTAFALGCEVTTKLGAIGGSDIFANPPIRTLLTGGEGGIKDERASGPPGLAPGRCCRYHWRHSGGGQTAGAGADTARARFRHRHW